MKPAIGLVVLLSLPAFVGCSTVSVSADYDESAEFSELRTFAWMPEPERGSFDLEVENPLVRSRIQDAIVREFEAKGYRQVDEAPDFYVTYHARTQQKSDVRSVPIHGPMLGPHWSGTYTDVHHYEEGTLVIDLIDANTQHLVWRGVAKAAVDWQGAPERKTKLINEAVQKILAQFPPKRS